MKNFEDMSRYEKLGMVSLWLNTAIEDDDEVDSDIISALAGLGIQWAGDARQALNAVRAARKAERA